MITAKEAVTAAAEYMRYIYGSDLEGLLVEEIELDSPSRVWRVTMGFWQALPPKRATPAAAALAQLMEARRVKRAYKALEISVDDGSVLSMKIRVLPSPDESDG